MVQQVSMSISLPGSFEEDIESLLSEQDDLTPESLFGIEEEYSDSTEYSEESSSDSDDNEISILMIRTAEEHHQHLEQFLAIIQKYGIMLSEKKIIPHLSSYTCHLSKMLKKDPPPWGTEQTTAVKRLKELVHNPPPLTIPSTGHLILQTDASNHAWGAILLENLNNKEQLCGYASGQFSPSERHYHSTYKEILAVKYGIKKFKFFLIG
ncbi:uncharacterized protein LOC125369256 [Ricinus communis]|uniref:uncharacterized protein LOC125369256 n=1 Tax=Ricinus communis TaxID=3988 RepID=UPI00201AF05E|nr:uncharacterized protein LOC125369256 [Ricinus communis]